VQAGGSIGLPEASSALANHGCRGLRRVTRVVTAAGVLSIALVGLVVLVWGSKLLGLIYGPSFSQYWLAADLYALGAFISSFGIGAILVLKVTRHTRQWFIVSIVSLVSSLTATAVLAVAYGVTGAAAASIPSLGLSMIVLVMFGRRARLELAREEGERAGGTLPVEREGQSVVPGFG
jgi:O-antigen/teichoic acid export membrane protein